MAAELRAVLVKELQVLVGNPAQGPEGRVKGTGGMALGKDEQVLGPHHLVVEHHQGIEAGKIPPDVANAAFKMHLEQAFFSFTDGLIQRVQKDFAFSFI